MAMTADSSHGHQSPRGGFDGSTQNRKTLPSPWAQIVRGEPESTPPAVNQILPPSPPPPSTSPPTPVTVGSTADQFNFSDYSPHKTAYSPALEISVAAANTSDNNDNAGNPKKPVWKKPLNGVTEVSPVMGAVCWPALSESTKFSPKSSPSADSSPKIVVSDGSLSSPKGLVTPNSAHKQAASNAKPNATSNHVVPTRQRSMKRGGGGNGSGGGHSQNNFSHPPPPPPPPPFPLFAMPPNGYGNMIPTMTDQSPRESSYKGSSWETRPVGGFGPQPPAVDSRHSARRGNFGPRGDGHYHNNFGNRRDQDRGHYGNAREIPAQSQRSPRGFVRPPPPNTATFVPPQPVRPFASPMGYPDLVYIPALPMEPFRGMGMPFITHAPPAMIVPVPEPPLPAMLLHQIEYYFSDANLIRDEFLKSNMDDEGWVPVTLIAGFNRVKSMTHDIQLILDSLTSSTVLDVQDDKVRRYNDWQKWIPSSSRLSAESRSQTSSPSGQDMLTNPLHNMTVEETTANQNSLTVESSSNLEVAPTSSSEVAAHAHFKSSRDDCIEDASLS
ncbi:La-related protein 1C [Euphorbia peplus]|nr:La-related protein 1C [Euphorbia peplus]